MGPNRKMIMRQFHQEMTKARERLTATPHGVIGWLLKFIQTDLESLTPSEWMVLAYEVATFTEDDAPDRYSLPVAASSGWAVQAIPGETIECTLPTRKEATQLQESIRRFLEQFWENGVAPITFSDLTLILAGPGALHPRHSSLLIATKPKTKEFEYRVTMLLVRYGDQIRKCEECHRMFLAARSDQLFCDPRCQMRVASRKWRKGNKKKLTKEHR